MGSASALEVESVEAGAAPGVGSVVRRRFRAEDLHVLRAGSTTVAPEGVTFEGFTTLAPPFAPPDPLAPSLRLEGQRFFDEQHPDEAYPVLLLIGGRRISSPPGFGGRQAAVVDGAAAGAAVRPFLLTGADAGLPEAFDALVGWGPVTPETMATAAAAAHPLVPLDALRIAARDRADTGEVRVLAERLLHPATPQEARTAALELVGDALRSLRPGSPEADALVALTAWSWRLERRHAPEAAYLELWSAAAEQVRASPAAGQVRAMALDRTAADARDALRRRLAEELGGGGGGG